MEEILEGATENPRGFGDTPEDAMQDETENATPAEQQDYDLLTIRARKMIFGKGKEKILELLGSSESPSKGIGKAGSMLMKSLIQSAKQQDRDISPEAAINAGAAIADDLNELAKANGVFQYDSPQEEEKELKDGVLYGVKLFGDGMIASGELTPEITSLAQKQVKDAIAEEGDQATTPNTQMKPVNAAVNQAMGQPQPAGLVGGAMQQEEQM